MNPGNSEFTSEFFDESSTAWMANKLKKNDCTYVYKCNHLLLSGRPCKNVAKTNMKCGTHAKTNAKAKSVSSQIKDVPVLLQQ